MSDFPKSLRPGILGWLVPHDLAEAILATRAEPLWLNERVDDPIREASNDG